MKSCVLCILLSAGILGGKAGEERSDTLSAVFWNVENFFDWRNDSTSVSDADFSSRGVRHWTRKRFETKCNAIAKTLLWTASEAGRLPDIVAFAEVENAFVLKRLLKGTLLRKLDYRIVHFDSPDRRGIDVALLYRNSILKLLDSKACHLYTDSLTIMPTRDILLCRFRLQVLGGTSAGIGQTAESLVSGTEPECPEREFAVLVNHHPSKYGGTAVSDARRRAAVGRLRFLADSLSAMGAKQILAFGDFNDTPANSLYKTLEPRLLPLYGALFRQGDGTIRYDGRWELIDLAFASPGPGLPFAPASHAYVGRKMAAGGTDSRLHHSTAPPGPEPALTPALWAGPMQILRPPFLRSRDSVHGGWKPLRTYSGPRYLGGVSDHCPVLVRLYIGEKR